MNDTEIAKVNHHKAVEIRLHTILAIASFVISALATAGDLFKCEGQNGTISYSDQHCDPGSIDHFRQQKAVVPHYDLPEPQVSLVDLQGIWRDDPGSDFASSWVFSGDQLTIATRLGYPIRAQFWIQNNLITLKQRKAELISSSIRIGEYSRHMMTLSWGATNVTLYRQ